MRHVPAASSASPAWVARWDLDKTYLRTEFDTVRDLVRTAFERAETKRTMPGAAALLREIGDVGAYVHILSGSPEQMRRRIVEKLALDGVRHDALTLKPNLRNLLRLRFRALRDQLGYKLPALLAARVHTLASLDAGAVPPVEVLVGDDSESDAFVYSLYADVLAGRVGLELLREILRRGAVYPDALDETLRLAGEIAPGDAVRRILIHLDRQTPPSSFAGYGARLVPFFNYLQAAFVLHDDGLLAPAPVLRVASDFATTHRFDAEALARSYLDLGRRGFVHGARGAELGRALAEEPALTGAREVAEMCRRIDEAAEDVDPGSIDLRTPDYLRLVASHTRRR